MSSSYELIILELERNTKMLYIVYIQMCYMYVHTVGSVYRINYKAK